jgi:hypothetical protein
MASRCRPLNYPLAKVKEVFNKWLYFENDEFIDEAATYVANKIKSDPLWVMFVGTPSNAKTEGLRAFDGHKDAFFLSTLTPSTLISGMDRKGKPDPSLIYKIDGKLLVFKDFTSILSLRSDNKMEIIGQLREIHDGQYKKSFGTGESKEWHGQIGLIGACTPVYDAHHAVIGELGERFLLYRIRDNNATKMAKQAQKIIGKEDKMRKEIRDSIHKFINQFKDLGGVDIKQTPKNVNDMIINLACLVAYARCSVKRERYSRRLTYHPLPEGTPRLTKQLTQMGIALAIVGEENVIDGEIYQTIKKIGQDLITTQRLRILKCLWDEECFEHTKEWRRTKTIADLVRLPTSTVKMVLEDLMVVDLANRQFEEKEGEDEDGKKNIPYVWQLTELAYDFMTNCDFFEEKN